MENQTTNNVDTNVPQIHQLTKVTTLSKYFALALMVALPFIGGVVGYSLAPERVVEQVVVQEVEVNREADTDAVEMTSQVGWKTYVDEIHKYSFEYPASWTLTTDLSRDMLIYAGEIDPVSLKKDREVATNDFMVFSKPAAGCATPEASVTIAGESAKDSSWVPAMVTECREISFSEGLTIVLNAEFEGKQKEILEKILSTFKFTE